MRKTVTVLAIAVLMTGCMSSEVQKYGSVETDAKTITVPPGSGGILGGIKRVLAENGWRMSISRGPTVTEGTVGSRTRLETTDTFNTRYRLAVNWRQFDLCIIGGGAYFFDISIIDNRTGSELLTMSGRDCETPIIRKFSEAIRG